MDVDKLIAEVLKNEGGYVNDPDDSGGETNFGITVGVARANGFSGNMADLPLSKAIEIYKTKYWKPLYGSIESKAIAYKLFDFGVNAGPKRAVTTLQRAMNEKTGINIKEDGVFGSITLSMLNSYIRERGELFIYNAYIETIKAFYADLIRRRPKDVKYQRGWLKRTNHNPYLVVK